MKPLTCLRFAIFILAVGLASTASANWMGGFVLESGDAARFGHGQLARINFDFSVTNANGARFVVWGFDDGSSIPGQIWGGSSVYAMGTEASHTNFITYNVGDVEVDQYRIVMFDPVTSAVLLEMFLPVEYFFGPHGVTDIQLSHTSPSWLRNEDFLTIDFAYQTDEPGGVRISARPTTNGTLTPGYGASGVGLSPVGSGTSSQSFTFPSAPADVDAIWFRVYNADYSALLMDFQYPIDMHWGPHGISNITISPSSPECLAHDQRVTVEFDYATSDPGGCLAWAKGANPDGGSILYQSYNGSIPLPQTGHLVREFWFQPAAGEGEVGFVRLSMADASNTEEYLVVMIPVFYKFGPNAVQNVQFHPASPAVLDPGDRVDITFDYVTTEAGGARVWEFPYTHSLPSTNYGVSGSLLYTGTGSGTGFFTINTGGAIVTKVRMGMWNADQSVFLTENFVAGQFNFGGIGGLSAVEGLPPVPGLVLGQNYPNPFNPATSISFDLPTAGHVSLKVYDVRGRLARTLVDGPMPAGPNVVSFDGTGLASGTYFYAIDTAHGVEAKQMVLIK